jgi:hypothetical protein
MTLLVNWEILSLVLALCLEVHGDRYVHGNALNIIE